jgi:DNA-binding protein Fis
VLVSSHRIINLSDIQEAIAQDSLAESVPPPAEDQPLSAYISELLGRTTRGEMEDAHARVTAAVERELYGQAIQLSHGEQAKAAKWLGVSRPTMREKLLRYGLHPGVAKTTESVA